ncbi:hypothetical protein [Parendozoicomonas haliclonae]|uniref:Chromosome partition protein Smc n=1 Tax=Parendozoicomonas haliclonae TaxID=1960125 RepID=A0A1X7AN10_9GAMM|nr:hypothetical protein [Parendozoicomonas haliclonae]SMA49436.1 hypothetical protein EHSB41UT_03258 [Parendozoicomonas haliclonae]
MRTLPRNLPRQLALSLLSLACLQGVAADEGLRDDDWFASQHGPLVSCSSIEARSDGTFVLDRFLYVHPDTQQVVPGGKKEQREHTGLTGQMIKTDRDYQSLTPFFHERYQLDGGYQIQDGFTLRGVIPWQADYSDWQAGHCDGLAGLAFQAETDYLNRKQFEGGKESWSLSELKNSEAEVTEGSEGVLMVPDTTPLLLLARQLPGNYRQVYDPLYQRGAASLLSYRDYRPYSNDHIRPLKYTLGGSALAVGASGAGLVLMGAVFSPMVLPCTLTAGLIGVAASLWYMSDGLQTAHYRAGLKHAGLKKTADEMEQKLASLRGNEDSYRMALRDDFGWDSKEHDLKMIMHTYQAKRRQHEQTMKFQEERLSGLKAGLAERQAKLKHRTELDQQFRDQELDLSQQRKLLTSLESQLYRNINHKAPKKAHGSDEKPVSADELMQKWETTNSTVNQLTQAHDTLQKERDQLDTWRHLDAEVADHNELVIEAEKAQRSRQQTFDRDYGRPLELLEKLHAVADDIEELDRQVRKQDKAVEKTAVHARLMALVTAYESYQRAPRYRFSEEEE